MPDATSRGRVVRRWVARALAALFVVVGVMLPRIAASQISPGKLARGHKSLEGATQCVQCHPLSRAPMATACLSCHKDVKSLIDQKSGYHGRLPVAQRMECASCHPDHAGEDFAMIAWPPPSKARFDHRQAGWALEGKHADAKCESCHATKYRKAPVATLSKRQTGTPWIGLETTCVSCHQNDDIHNGELKGGCEQCHTAKAWAPAPKFDHAKARYPLAGKHVDVKCNGCHKSSRLVLKLSSTGAKIPLYRPVAFAKCSDCHTDPHKGRIREACTSCHETTGWDAIDKRGFNHNATRYPLKSRHTRVSCAACHGKDNERPTPSYATCAGCHADVHRAEQGQGRDCASCHVVDGFAPATYSVADHAKTAYPLLGKHIATKCAACHTTTNAGASGPIGSVTPNMSVAVAASAPVAGVTANTPRGSYVRLKMPSSTCASCHADVHAGQPATRNAIGGCASCHSVAGFAPSTTTVAAHAAFRFALDGAHASATCVACHAADRRGMPSLTVASGKAKFVFTLGDTACATCHADPHAGRYLAGGARAALGCRACHGTTKFRPSNVTTGDHTRLGFVLDGAHRTVSCVECHNELAAPAARSSLRLAATNLPALPFTQARGATCGGCHAEVHGTQFAKRKDRGACEGCHITARFAGAEKFDHEKGTRFPLAGAHRTVACAKCHVVTPSAAATTPESARRQYAGVSMACESCHASKPGGVR